MHMLLLKYRIPLNSVSEERIVTDLEVGLQLNITLICQPGQLNIWRKNVLNPSFSFPRVSEIYKML